MRLHRLFAADPMAHLVFAVNLAALTVLWPPASPDARTNYAFAAFLVLMSAAALLELRAVSGRAANALRALGVLAFAGFGAAVCLAAWAHGHAGRSLLSALTAALPLIAWRMWIAWISPAESPAPPDGEDP